MLPLFQIKLLKYIIYKQFLVYLIQIALLSLLYPM